MTAAVCAEALGLGRDEVVDGLRAWARAGGSSSAAVELLVGHGVWLGRRELRELLWVEDDLVGLDPAELAGLALLVPATWSELAVLEVAVELLGVKSVTPLGRLLVGHDPRTTALLLDALVGAAGWDRGGVTFAAPYSVGGGW